MTVLKKVREQQGLSQRQLGCLVGVRRSYVSNIENLVQKPGLGTILAISEVLQVDPGSLLLEVD